MPRSTRSSRRGRAIGAVNTIWRDGRPPRRDLDRWRRLPRQSRRGRARLDRPRRARRWSSAPAARRAPSSGRCSSAASRRSMSSTAPPAAPKRSPRDFGRGRPPGGMGRAARPAWRGARPRQHDVARHGGAAAARRSTSAPLARRIASSPTSSTCRSRPALLAAARGRGLRTVDGLGMLLHQAAPGFGHWFGRTPEVTPELRTCGAPRHGPRLMLVLGLTGSAAMGKSTVAAMFAARGVPVFDADRDGPRALRRRRGAGGRGGVSRRRPSDGVVDRDRLRDRVLGDDAAMARLEALVHPLVKRRGATLPVPRRGPAGGGSSSSTSRCSSRPAADGEVDAVLVVSAPADDPARRGCSRGRG